MGVPDQQTAGQQTAGQQSPGGESPGGESPGQESPGEEASGGQSPGVESSGGQSPGEETFDAFYRASRQRLFDTVYALTGNAAEAQDAVHEAYARAWQRWSKVGDYGDPEAWVRTVARRVAVSRWRRARNRGVAHRRLGEPPPLAGPGPDKVALVAALAQIPEPQRVAVVLHHLVGLPVAEVAAETGAPVGTVKARLARGRRALAELLGVPEHAPDKPEGVHV